MEGAVWGICGDDGRCPKRAAEGTAFQELRVARRLTRLCPD